LRLIPDRVEQDELLDLGDGTPADVRQSLADLWRINRFLGGIDAVTRHLTPLFRAGETTTIADLGTGAGQIAGYIARWARRKKFAARVIGVDFSARNLRVAQGYTRTDSDVCLLAANALQVPFAANSVDIVMSSLFMHHFAPDLLVQLLHESFRVARRALVMSDLTRGYLPLAGFKLAQPVFARSYITRFDGMVSIRRAYTPDELRGIAQRAGLTNVRIYRHWAWRMTLVAEKVAAKTEKA
jgi:ubiquinone/menaquinone biosynthesis C-methylase UbiE